MPARALIRIDPEARRGPERSGRLAHHIQEEPMSTTAESIRNGVDTGQLFGTLDAIKGEPTLATFQFRAKNRWIALGAWGRVEACSWCWAIASSFSRMAGTSRLYTSIRPLSI